ncbi:2-deoxyglucose-6-phosphatase [Grimontia sp. AD028]|uniref:2-deoxyglucose-6-phosphate hydrolase YniC n=1 Tax=Grimontia indica TaxID=1056512 RepID=R1ID71_9GAMM|nr:MULTISPECIES: hexitol phosphatase HxpB [Grimontia]EOD78706.1 2-deoxyglucose-6-phosphate hydrolase YniC [Grimontia indica]KKD59181.1 2-deoxyglucose-6-phosphatase [Grimontia sp. AD028]
MIQAAIFDMDGLLVDSEPFWQDAQLAVLQGLGVTLTRQDTIDTTGIRIDQIIKHYYKTQGWEGPSCEEVCDMILDKVIELVSIHKPMKPGVMHALTLCKEANLRIALASSSPLKLINATLEALGIEAWFEQCHSAEHLKYGKPHPEVYLNAAEGLGIAPQNCVALEDSFTGLLAAKAAQMRTIVVPEHEVAAQERWVISDVKLTSLDELSIKMLEA